MAGTLRETVLLVAVVPASTAKDYTVGESSGWTTVPGPKGRRFHVGDTLSFQYRTGHSVEEVSAAGHGACSTSNPLRSYKDQSTTIALTKPGTRYFICGTTGHCALGMKLAVTVVSGSGSSAPRNVEFHRALSAKPSSKPTGSDDATSAAATTAAPGFSSKLSSNTSVAACSGVRLATLLLLVAVGLSHPLLW